MHLRNDWTRAETQALYQQPFLDLVFQAQQIHRQYFEANAIQVSTLLSIKTGKCPEDCKYCSQSARYDSKLEAEKRIAVEKVISEAQQAKASGSTRFCMGAAWRNPHERDMPYVLDTPLAEVDKLDVTEWIRTIAVARIIMPKSYIRLSAGRESLSDADQALAFMAGANSLFSGEKLLTTPNTAQGKDQQLFQKLGLHAEKAKLQLAELTVDAMAVA